MKRTSIATGLAVRQVRVEEAEGTRGCLRSSVVDSEKEAVDTDGSRDAGSIPTWKMTLMPASRFVSEETCSPTAPVLKLAFEARARRD